MSLEGGKLICLDDEDSEGGKPSKTIVAKGRTLSIGYYTHCDYILSHPNAEGKHCEIVYNMFQGELIYNSSIAHPIKLDGQTVYNYRPLKDGSKITVLDKHFVWHSSRSKSHATAEILTGDERPAGSYMSPLRQSLESDQRLRVAMSCPDIKKYREIIRRFTIHNFSHCIKSNEAMMKTCTFDMECKTDLKSNEGIEKKGEIPNTEITVSSLDIPSNDNNTAEDDIIKEKDIKSGATCEPQGEMHLINCTKNTENVNSLEKKQLLSLCSPSNMIITCYSPRETGVRMGKSYTMSKEPKILALSTPQSYLKQKQKQNFSTSKTATPQTNIIKYYNNDNEVEKSENLINLNTPSTSRSCLMNLLSISKQRNNVSANSMHIIDLTITPEKCLTSGGGSSYQKIMLATPLCKKKLISDKSLDHKSLGLSKLPLTPILNSPVELDVNDGRNSESNDSIITVSSGELDGLSLMQSNTTVSVVSPIKKTSMIHSIEKTPNKVCQNSTKAISENKATPTSSSLSLRKKIFFNNSKKKMQNVSMTSKKATTGTAINTTNTTTGASKFHSSIVTSKVTTKVTNPTKTIENRMTSTKNLNISKSTSSSTAPNVCSSKSLANKIATTISNPPNRYGFTTSTPHVTKYSQRKQQQQEHQHPQQQQQQRQHKSFIHGVKRKSFKAIQNSSRMSKTHIVSSHTKSSKVSSLLKQKSPQLILASHLVSKARKSFYPKMTNSSTRLNTAVASAGPLPLLSSCLLNKDSNVNNAENDVNSESNNSFDELNELSRTFTVDKDKEEKDQFSTSKVIFSQKISHLEINSEEDDFLNEDNDCNVGVTETVNGNNSISLPKVTSEEEVNKKYNPVIKELTIEDETNKQLLQEVETALNKQPEKSNETTKNDHILMENEEDDEFFDDFKELENNPIMELDDDELDDWDLELIDDKESANENIKVSVSELLLKENIHGKAVTDELAVRLDYKNNISIEQMKGKDNGDNVDGEKTEVETENSTKNNYEKECVNKFNIEESLEIDCKDDKVDTEKIKSIESEISLRDVENTDSVSVSNELLESTGKNVLNTDLNQTESNDFNKTVSDFNEKRTVSQSSSSLKHVSNECMKKQDNECEISSTQQLGTGILLRELQEKLDQSNKDDISVGNIQSVMLLHSTVEIQVSNKCEANDEGARNASLQKPMEETKEQKHSTLPNVIKENVLELEDIKLREQDAEKENNEENVNLNKNEKNEKFKLEHQKTSRHALLNLSTIKKRDEIKLSDVKNRHKYSYSNIFTLATSTPVKEEELIEDNNTVTKLQGRNILTLKKKDDDGDSAIEHLPNRVRRASLSTEICKDNSIKDNVHRTTSLTTLVNTPPPKMMRTLNIKHLDFSKKNEGSIGTIFEENDESKEEDIQEQENKQDHLIIHKVKDINNIKNTSPILFDKNQLSIKLDAETQLQQHCTLRRSSRRASISTDNCYVCTPTKEKLTRRKSCSISPQRNTSKRTPSKIHSSLNKTTRKTPNRLIMDNQFMTITTSRTPSKTKLNDSSAQTLNRRIKFNVMTDTDENMGSIIEEKNIENIEWEQLCNKTISNVSSQLDILNEDVEGIEPFNKTLLSVVEVEECDGNIMSDAFNGNDNFDTVENIRIIKEDNNAIISKVQDELAPNELVNASNEEIVEVFGDELSERIIASPLHVTEHLDISQKVVISENECIKHGLLESVELDQLRTLREDMHQVAILSPLNLHDKNVFTKSSEVKNIKQERTEEIVHIVSEKIESNMTDKEQTTSTEICLLSENVKETENIDVAQHSKFSDNKIKNESEKQEHFMEVEDNIERIESLPNDMLENINEENTSNKVCTEKLSESESSLGIQLSVANQSFKVEHSDKECTSKHILKDLHKKGSLLTGNLPDVKFMDDFENNTIFQEKNMEQVRTQSDLNEEIVHTVSNKIESNMIDKEETTSTGLCILSENDKETESVDVAQHSKFNDNEIKNGSEKYECFTGGKDNIETVETLPNIEQVRTEAELVNTVSKQMESKMIDNPETTPTEICLLSENDKETENINVAQHSKFKDNDIKNEIEKQEHFMEVEHNIERIESLPNEMLESINQENTSNKECIEKLSESEALLGIQLSVANQSFKVEHSDKECTSKHILKDLHKKGSLLTEDLPDVKSMDDFENNTIFQEKNMEQVRTQSDLNEEIVHTVSNKIESNMIDKEETTSTGLCILSENDKETESVDVAQHSKFNDNEIKNGSEKYECFTGGKDNIETVETLPNIEQVRTEAELVNTVSKQMESKMIDNPETTPTEICLLSENDKETENINVAQHSKFKDNDIKNEIEKQEHFMEVGDNIERIESLPNEMLESINQENTSNKECIEKLSESESSLGIQLSVANQSFKVEHSDKECTSKHILKDLHKKGSLLTENLPDVKSMDDFENNTIFQEKNMEQVRTQSDLNEEIVHTVSNKIESNMIDKEETTSTGLCILSENDKETESVDVAQHSKFNDNEIKNGSEKYECFTGGKDNIETVETLPNIEQVRTEAELVNTVSKQMESKMIDNPETTPTEICLLSENDKETENINVAQHSKFKDNDIKNEIEKQEHFMEVEDNIESTESLSNEMLENMSEVDTSNKGYIGKSNESELALYMQSSVPSQSLTSDYSDKLDVNISILEDLHKKGNTLIEDSQNSIVSQEKNIEQVHTEEIVNTVSEKIESNMIDKEETTSTGLCILSENDKETENIDVAQDLNFIDNDIKNEIEKQEYFMEVEDNIESTESLSNEMLENINEENTSNKVCTEKLSESESSLGIQLSVANQSFKVEHSDEECTSKHILKDLHKKGSLLTGNLPDVKSMDDFENNTIFEEKNMEQVRTQSDLNEEIVHTVSKKIESNMIDKEETTSTGLCILSENDKETENIDVAQHSKFSDNESEKHEYFTENKDNMETVESLSNQMLENMSEEDTSDKGYIAKSNESELALYMQSSVPSQSLTSDYSDKLDVNINILDDLHKKENTLIEDLQNSIVSQEKNIEQVHTEEIVNTVSEKIESNITDKEQTTPTGLCKLSKNDKETENINVAQHSKFKDNDIKNEIEKQEHFMEVEDNIERIESLPNEMLESINQENTSNKECIEKLSESEASLGIQLSVANQSFKVEHSDEECTSKHILKDLHEKGSLLTENLPDVKSMDDFENNTIFEEKNMEQVRTQSDLNEEIVHTVSEKIKSNMTDQKETTPTGLCILSENDKETENINVAQLSKFSDNEIKNESETQEHFMEVEDDIKSTESLSNEMLENINEENTSNKVCTEKLSESEASLGIQLSVANQSFKVEHSDEECTSKHILKDLHEKGSLLTENLLDVKSMDDFENNTIFEEKNMEQVRTQSDLYEEIVHTVSEKIKSNMTVAQLSKFKDNEIKNESEKQEYFMEVEDNTERIESLSNEMLENRNKEDISNKVCTEMLSESESSLGVQLSVPIESLAPDNSNDASKTIKYTRQQIIKSETNQKFELKKDDEENYKHTRRVLSKKSKIENRIVECDNIDPQRISPSSFQQSGNVYTVPETIVQTLSPGSNSSTERHQVATVLQKQTSNKKDNNEIYVCEPIKTRNRKVDTKQNTYESKQKLVRTNISKKRVNRKKEDKKLHEQEMTEMIQKLEQLESTSTEIDVTHNDKPNEFETQLREENTFFKQTYIEESSNTTPDKSQHILDNQKELLKESKSVNKSVPEHKDDINVLEGITAINLHSQLHEMSVNPNDPKISALNTSENIVRPLNQSKRPQRKVAAAYRNYDETSDNEMAAVTSNNKSVSQKTPIKSSQSVVVVESHTKDETITPVILKTTRGRVRRPTVLVQQFLEQERAKGDSAGGRKLVPVSQSTGNITTSETKIIDNLCSIPKKIMDPNLIPDISHTETTFFAGVESKIEETVVNRSRVTTSRRGGKTKRSNHDCEDASRTESPITLQLEKNIKAVSVAEDGKEDSLTSCEVLEKPCSSKSRRICKPKHLKEQQKSPENKNTVILQKTELSVPEETALEAHTIVKTPTINKTRRGQKPIRLNIEQEKPSKMESPESLHLQKQKEELPEEKTLETSIMSDISSVRKRQRRCKATNFSKELEETPQKKSSVVSQLNKQEPKVEEAIINRSRITKSRHGSKTKRGNHHCEDISQRKSPTLVQLEETIEAVPVPEEGIEDMLKPDEKEKSYSSKSRRICKLKHLKEQDKSPENKNALTLHLQKQKEELSVPEEETIEANAVLKAPTTNRTRRGRKAIRLNTEQENSSKKESHETLHLHKQEEELPEEKTLETNTLLETPSLHKRGHRRKLTTLSKDLEEPLRKKSTVASQLNKQEALPIHDEAETETRTPPKLLNTTSTVRTRRCRKANNEEQDKLPQSKPDISQLQLMPAYEKIVGELPNSQTMCKSQHGRRGKHTNIELEQKNIVQIVKEEGTLPESSIPQTSVRSAVKRNAAAAANFRIEEDAIAAAAIDPPKKTRCRKVPSIENGESDGQSSSAILEVENRSRRTKRNNQKDVNSNNDASNTVTRPKRARKAKGIVEADSVRR